MNNLKISFVVFSLILLVTGSCHKSSKQDISLTLKEYQKLGMPDLNKKWTIYDLINADISLNSLKRTNPLLLPRKNSKKSGMVLSKILSKENLSFVNDTSLSLRIRAYLIQHFQKLQNEIIVFYTNKSKDEQYYNEELIDMYIFGLFIHEKMIELSWKIMNSKEKSDIEIQYGQNTVLNNYVKMISFVLGEQLKSRIYARKDLDRLSEEISNSVIKNMTWMKPENKEKIRIQIQDAIEKSTSGFAKNNYRKTLKVLNNTNQ
jgi:hypothetical protein